MMPNTYITLYEEVVSNTGYIGYRRIGIVDTPCYPCRYYAGYIWKDGTPVDTETGNYHRTVDEALNALVAFTTHKESTD